MTLKRTTTVPTMKFGSGRSGTLLLSLGKRGRVTLKGEASFNLTEAHAFVGQLLWYLDQVAMGALDGGSGKSTTPAHGLPQLDLYGHLSPNAVQSAQGSASGK